MKDHITINRTHIIKAKAGRKVPTIRQFESLGFKAPFLGWEDEILGKEFLVDDVIGFVNVNKHKNNKKPQRSKKKRKSKLTREAYKAQYKRQEWIELRDRIVFRDGNKCVLCKQGAKYFHVHHLLYEKGKSIWNVPDCYLITLCPGCHKKEHSKTFIIPPKHF